MITEKEILNLKDNDGMTLKQYKEIIFKSGYQVATEGVECKTIPETLQAIKEFNGNGGIWFSNGIYYVDKSRRVNTKKEALTIGRAHNQISILNWRTMGLVYC